MDIKKAEFVISAAKLSQCPTDGKPEFAFIGRSNVGKSSLINMLTGRKGLAKTSATPGKTLLINHFNIDDSWYIVDLPGYGYAKQSRKVREGIDKMIDSYMLNREELVNVFLLIDIRHDPQKIDRAFMDWLGENGIPFAIVFTKADKLGPVRARMNAEKYLKTLLDVWEELPPHFITSSENRTGKEQLLEYIDACLTPEESTEQ